MLDIHVWAWVLRKGVHVISRLLFLLKHLLHLNCTLHCNDLSIKQTILKCNLKVVSKISVLWPHNRVIYGMAGLSPTRPCVYKSGNHINISITYVLLCNTVIKVILHVAPLVWIGNYLWSEVCYLWLYWAIYDNHWPVNVREVHVPSEVVLASYMSHRFV